MHRCIMAHHGSSVKVVRPRATAGVVILPTVVDELAGRYSAVRAATESIAEPLSAEDQTVQSMPDVSPTKWHRAHVTWFFETFVLAPHRSDHRLYDPDFGYLFNSYYELVGARFPRPSRGLITRPGIAEIAEYRGSVDRSMAELMAGDLPDGVEELIELGLHHEQQHQELMLMDILHVLSRNPLRPAYRPDWSPPAPATCPASWIGVDGGPVEIGHDTGRDTGAFSFDNEGPRHTVWLEPHALAARLVTNAEWADFIADGGYRRPELWLSDGWATVQSEGWSAPLYWSDGPDGWTEFTLAGEAPLEPAAAVVHVSHYEADAYARWTGARLPTEAEWEHAVATRSGELADAFGSVWQWTASPYVPYPRYRTPPGAVGEYNAKFMSNQMVLRGSCVTTPTGHERVSYRNFFPPSARWAFGGVRLATDR